MSDEPKQTDNENTESTAGESPEEETFAAVGGRAAVGGVLMGLANLVPGISGGTMLVASGIYPRFIQAIAELTRFKFKKLSIFTLGVVVVAALASILLLAGPVKSLVVEHRWVMYSLFIGLTLGGIPVVWKMAKPANGSLKTGAIVGFLLMALIAWFQYGSASGDAAEAGFGLMFIAGVAGASAMILPGVSGGYLLLVLGVYVPILTGVSEFKDGLKSGSFEAMQGPLMNVVLPVGIGVVVGVLVVANILKIALERYEKFTLGMLLGFLGGAVIGLWPFQEGQAPEIGSTFRGAVVTAESLAEIPPEKYDTVFFDPEITHIAGAIGLIVLGFGLTALVAKLGASKDDAKAAAKEAAEA